MSNTPDIDIEVFTQQHCAPCRLVEAFLRERGMPFIVRDVDRDPAALDTVIARGYMTAPVTRIGVEWVVGFNKRALERLLAPWQ